MKGVQEAKSFFYSISRLMKKILINKKEITIEKEGLFEKDAKHQFLLIIFHAYSFFGNQKMKYLINLACDFFSYYCGLG